LKIKEHSITKASKQSKKSLDFGQTQLYIATEEAGNGGAGVQSVTRTKVIFKFLSPLSLQEGCFFLNEYATARTERA